MSKKKGGSHLKHHSTVRRKNRQKVKAAYDLARRHTHNKTLNTFRNLRDDYRDLYAMVKGRRQRYPKAIDQI